MHMISGWWGGKMSCLWLYNIKCVSLCLRICFQWSGDQFSFSSFSIPCPGPPVPSILSTIRPLRSVKTPARPNTSGSELLWMQLTLLVRIENSSKMEQLMKCLLQKMLVASDIGTYFVSLVLGSSSTSSSWRVSQKITRSLVCQFSVCVYFTHVSSDGINSQKFSR